MFGHGKHGKHPRQGGHSRRSFLRIGAATAAGALLRPSLVHAGGIYRSLFERQVLELGGAELDRVSAAE